jgi:tetratricopeptide (TPR) repeat protein
MLLSWSWYIKHIAKKWPKISFPFDQDTLMKYRNLPGIRDERFDKIVVSNIAKFPVYVGPGTEEYVQNFLSFPKGALFKLLPTSIEKEKEKIAQELEKNKLEFIVRGTGRNIFKDREALKTLYNYSAICNIKGDFYRQYQIDIEKAISEYKKALELDPCNLHSRLNLAFAYLEKGELDGAKCEFERVIEENKNFNPSFVHYGLGLVYQNKGMIEQARREYKIALNIDPTNTYAKQMLKKCKNFR